MYLTKSTILNQIVCFDKFLKNSISYVGKRSIEFQTWHESVKKCMKILPKISLFQNEIFSSKCSAFFRFLPLNFQNSLMVGKNTIQFFAQIIFSESYKIFWHLNCCQLHGKNSAKKLNEFSGKYSWEWHSYQTGLNRSIAIFSTKTEKKTFENPFVIFDMVEKYITWYQFDYYVCLFIELKLR
jgi:hypothetical protein